MEIIQTGIFGCLKSGKGFACTKNDPGAISELPDGAQFCKPIKNKYLKRKINVAARCFMILLYFEGHDVVMQKVSDNFKVV